MTAIRAERVGWREDAACGKSGYPPELWFTHTVEARRIAKFICSRCPVLDDCTEYTMDAAPRRGISAGMTYSEVVKRRKERKP